MTKIKVDCQSGRKVVPHDSKSDLPLVGSHRILSRDPTHFSGFRSGGCCLCLDGPPNWPATFIFFPLEYSSGDSCKKNETCRSCVYIYVHTYLHIHIHSVPKISNNFGSLLLEPRLMGCNNVHRLQPLRGGDKGLANKIWDFICMEI